MLIEDELPYTEGPTSISIGLASDTKINVGELIWFYVYDENRNELYASESVNFSSENDAIVYVNYASIGMGYIEGISKGESVEITASSKSNPSVYDTITVTVVDPYEE